MTKCIIYRNDRGGIAVIHPTPEAVAALGIDEIARKDVPAGLPYRIVDVSDLPADRSQRALWAVDASDLTDGVGADYGVGSARTVVGYDGAGHPITEEASA